jgi:hypothetical protein
MAVGIEITGRQRGVDNPAGRGPIDAQEAGQLTLADGLL